MYVVFYFQPLPAMLKSPFELKRECLPLRDHINDDFKKHHRLANPNTHNHTVLRIFWGRSKWTFVLIYVVDLPLMCLLFHLKTSVLWLLVLTIIGFQIHPAFIRSELCVPTYSFLGSIFTLFWNAWPTLSNRDLDFKMDTRDANIHNIKW